VPVVGEAWHQSIRFGKLARIIASPIHIALAASLIRASTSPSRAPPALLGHEAIRDRVRAREAAMEDLRAKRKHLQSFLLRHGRIYPGLRSWTLVHARWLSSLTFEHSAQYLVLREYRQANEDAEARLERLTQQVADVVSTWSMAPVVEAYQAMRGVAFLTDTQAADGLSRSGTLGTLDRRAGPTWQHHQGW
jgi:hypothetical protein